MSELICGAVALVLIGVPVLLAHYGRTPCPNCSRRGTLRWKHVRKDGRPDLRFAVNPRYCVVCRWNSLLGPPPAEPTEAELEARRAAKEAEARSCSERQEREQPARALTSLLVSVAKADRQITTAERDVIIDRVEAFSPGLVERALISSWIDVLDSTRAPEVFARDIDRARWPEVLASVELVSLADGKATPAEKRRVAAIRCVLGGGDDGNAGQPGSD